MLKKIFFFRQDFIMLKVLGNDVPKPETDIEKLKKEEYVIKKEPEELTTENIDSAIETNEIDSVLLTTTAKTQTTKFVSSISPTILDIFTTTQNEATTIERKVSLEPSVTVITDADVMITEYKDLEKTVTQHVTDILMTTDVTKITDGVDTVLTASSIDSPEKEKYGSDDKDTSSESIDTDEDYDDEYLRKKNFKYKGYQHTLPSSTLLHGFIANPGYPSYYIGSDRDCKWKIVMGKGQKMTLTILDLHLRGT